MRQQQHHDVAVAAFARDVEHIAALGVEKMRICAIAKQDLRVLDQSVFYSQLERRLTILSQLVG